VVIGANGRIQLLLARRANGTETTLASVQLPATISNVAGRTFTLVAEASGTAPTSLRAKLWITGQAEPGWQITAQDSTGALQRAGRVGVGHYISGSAGPLTPLSLAIDNLRWTQL
jgi:hypothetical protein